MGLEVEDETAEEKKTRPACSGRNILERFRHHTLGCSVDY